MAKQLNFTYKDKEYTLEFTRRTVSEMEKKGFVAAEVETKPMSTLPALFEGSFLAHHRFEKKEVIEKNENEIQQNHAYFSTSCITPRDNLYLL